MNTQIVCGLQWDLPWDARNLGLKRTIKISMFSVMVFSVEAGEAPEFVQELVGREPTWEDSGVSGYLGNGNGAK